VGWCVLGSSGIGHALKKRKKCHRLSGHGTGDILLNLSKPLWVAFRQVLAENVVSGEGIN
jgi:hypothetical protein